MKTKWIKTAADYSGMILIATYVGLAIVLFTISMTATARANSLVCDIYGDNGFKQIIFTEVPEKNSQPNDVRSVSTGERMWIGFYNGTGIYFRKHDCPTYIIDDRNGEQTALNEYLKRMNQK